MMAVNMPNGSRFDIHQEPEDYYQRTPAMKREADGDMKGSPQKRSRRGDEEVRLLIPSKAAGSIIGKGGCNITKLRSQYKASITVPDCPGPERMLTLSSDVPTICQIISDVIPNLEQNGAKVEDDLDLRMMIHQSQAGCVIGKAGAKIKELRSSTGARIKIFSICAPQSTDRIIQINGQDFQCINAIQEIIKLTKPTPIKGAVNQYNPHNYDEFYADEYGGFGCGGGAPPGGDMRRGGPGGPSHGGRGGGSGPGNGFNNRPPPPRGGRMGAPPMGNNFNERGGPMGPSGPGGPMHNRGAFGGPPPPPRGMNSGAGMNGGPPPFERNNGWSNGPPPPPMNGVGNGNMMNQMPPKMMQAGGGNGNNQAAAMGGNGGGVQGGNNGNNGGGKTLMQVTIPKDLAGAIIGKGGSRIRRIRQDSGAGITIDEPLPGSDERIITITGIPNQIQMAQYLLQQSVHNNTDQRNGY